MKRIEVTRKWWLIPWPLFHAALCLWTGVHLTGFYRYSLIGAGVVLLLTAALVVDCLYGWWYEIVDVTREGTPRRVRLVMCVRGWVASRIWRRRLVRKHEECPSDCSTLWQYEIWRV
jgi:hypothetical protein